MGKFARGWGLEAMQRFIGMFKDTRGATAIEYALIMAMIFLAIIIGVSAVGTSTVAAWTNVAEAFPDA